MDFSKRSGSELGESRDRSSESRVLLIGTDRHLEGSLEQQLTNLHCSFDHAAGSADALRQLRATPHAVVLTDPETSIHEDLALVDEIWRLRPGVRVIVLAPSGTPEDLIAALRRRVFLCQCAPFDVKDIARYTVSAIKADNSNIGIEVLSADRSWISVRMNCDLMNADRLTAFFKQFQMTLPERPPEEMMVAFEEILNNAIEHGAQNDPSKLLEVAAVRTARAFVFYISDPGKGFRPDAIPHAAISYSPDEPTRHIEVRNRAGMRLGGYGILVASGIVDELIYSEVGNEVLLIKHMGGLERRRSNSEESWISSGDNDLLEC
jgi:anti-sigma regulatory factor (Ser/Thr protein kinase)/ActR/RegA family two-component response regulator